MSRGQSTYTEILSQGNSWKETLEAANRIPTDLINWLKTPDEQTVFIGCGSTYYLSLTAASLWQNITGSISKGVPSSELWLYPDLVLGKKPVKLITVSRSGETSETLKAIEVFKKKREECYLSLVCYADSQMALKSPYLLLTQNAEEKSVAQTRSFSSMLILFQYVAGLASGDAVFMKEVKDVPNGFSRLLNNYEPLAMDLGKANNLDHFVFLGSGPNYGLACEAMLKMKEMSLSVSEAFHFLEFRHGPKSMVTKNTVVVGLISDSAKEEEGKVLAEMKELGATTIAISENNEDIKSDYLIELQSGVSELARGVLMLPFLQLMAYNKSMNKGLDPDRPKNLDSVVRF